MVHARGVLAAPANAVQGLCGQAVHGRPDVAESKTKQTRAQWIVRKRESYVWGEAIPGKIHIDNH